MKAPLISVIVPVYKVERYLSRCIESVLQQTYKNFELILVDDGSPDNCGLICDEYAKVDNRIKTIHKANGGVSSARNRGIEVSKGEFIYFIDSDDWIPNNSLQLHVNAMQTNSVELTIASSEHRSLKITVGPFKNELIDLYDENLDLNGILLKGYAPWNILYSKEIIQKNNIRFSEGMKYGEDTLFVREYLKYTKKIYTSSDIGYYYNRLNEKAATTKHYEQIIEWRLELLKSAWALLEQRLVENEKKIKAIHHLACIYFENCMTSWMNIAHYNKSIVSEKIQKCLDVFCPYLDFERCNKKKYNKPIETVIETKDVDLIYKIYKTYYKKQKIRFLFRGILINIFGSFLEQKRDNLRKTYKTK